MTPNITTLPKIHLIGQNIITSFANDETVELWRSFMSRKKEVRHQKDDNLYSVEIYPNSSFFDAFDPTKTFEKWAAISVSKIEEIPKDMEALTIPEGLYAVFHYKGKPSEAMDTFQYMYGEWLPNSAYEMDGRPFFALMGEAYKGEHPDSEESFWLPIKHKS